MKKISITVALLITALTSCEFKKVDNCACKFNLDIFIKNKNIDLDKYSKFYDEKTLEECFNVLKDGQNTRIDDAYKYYSDKCPIYKLEVEEN